MSSTSVALATYNGEKYLPAQLASIAAQTRRPDEVVVGDDQSTDGTAELLRRFALETGIRVHFTRNFERLGSSANFAAALSRCEGDVIFLCDQDDVWAPHKVATCLAAFDAHPEVGYVFSNANLISGSGKPIGGTLWRRAFFSAEQQEKFRRHRGTEVLLKTVVTVIGATMAIRRAALAPALPMPHGWAHDAWLSFIIELVYGAWPIDEPLVSYRLHPAQQSGLVGWSEPAKLVALMRRQDAPYYRSEANNYRILARRVLDLGDRRGETARRVEAKAAFLESRAGGREDLLTCLRDLPADWFARKYADYGVGAKHAAFDLVGGLDAAARRLRSRRA